MTGRTAGLFTGACLALSLSIGCDAPDITDVDLPPPVVRIEPGSAQLSANQSIQLQATLASSLSGSPIIWSSSNPQVAQVSPTGLVTAGSAGQAVITATAGASSGRSYVTVGSCLALVRPLRCS